MKAIVRYLAPDACASAAGLSPFHASKYGAKTCAGMGVAAVVAACASAPDPRTRPADATTVAKALRTAPTVLGRLMGKLPAGWDNGRMHGSAAPGEGRGPFL
ncbi:hypothetical protein JCM13580A_05570 [Streptomyces drozdowiczii]